MISLKQDFKHGMVSLKLNSRDDLWYLSHIISPGDLVRMKTERKLKIGDGENTTVVRKVMILTLEVELVSLENGQLRIKGLIREGPEDVPLASYHSFGVGVGDSLSITKNQWPNYIKKKLIDALNNAAESVLFIVFDRDQAHVSLLKQSGIEFLSSISKQGLGKEYQTSESAIFSELVTIVADYQKKYSPKGIVFASPSFWRQYVQNILPENIKSVSLFIDTSEVTKSTVYSLLARNEVNTLLSKQRLHNEEVFIEDVLRHLQKQELAYGFDDVRLAVDLGSVKSLGITESFLQKSREDGTYVAVDNLLKKTDSMQGKIQIIGDEVNTKKIDALGGIVGILRWKQ